VTTAAPSSRESSPVGPPAPAPRRLAKAIYGCVFCLLLPAALALWAHAISPLIPWPTLHSPALGLPLLSAGVLLILSAFYSLHRYGRGLPMNAFPPPVYVVQGPYRLVRHPIYLGFSVDCLGAAIASGSSGGQWLVTPVVLLGCTALIWGFERPDLLRRFGALVDRHQPLLHLPPDAPDHPTVSDRVSIYLLVLLPWLILYTATSAVPTPPGTPAGYLPFERQLPVIEWTELLYSSTYLMVLLVPLVARTQRDLRLFARAGLSSMIVIFLLYLVTPVLAPSRPFTPSSTLGRLLLIERDYDAHGTNACPSYHVFWALLAGVILAHRGKVWRYAGPAWAILISASCITTGQHTLVDVLAAFAIFPVFLFLPALYRQAVHLTERLANSFRARHLGPLRVINHSIYSGLAACAGILIIGTLTGPDHLLAVAVVALCSVIGAALWAQLIEGSPRLLRPFGYYGCIVGGILGTFAAPLLGSSTFLLLAAFAAAAPVIQAIGRLRCAVQGCCHGGPLPPTLSPDLGLRITNPSSRVCKLSPFANTPIHPTPLYSILGNLVITPLLARLWVVHAPLTLITGLYLILAGIARFVEEAYRGEPQTRQFAGLPEYQWYAIISVIVGAIITVLPLADRAPSPAPNLQVIPLALALALFTAFAMSTDFPKSNRRFARLTG